MVPEQTDDGSHSSDSHDHGHGGLQKYILVGIGLGILTAISFWAGSNETIMNTPQLGWTIMLAVSCCKALLVMLFFMHLIWEANWKYVLTIPASIMSLFLLLMLVPDIGYRTKKYSEERLIHAAEVQAESRSSSEHTPASESEGTQSTPADH